jgi:hypothetical protein
MVKIIDFPKIDSPFIRVLDKENNYFVTPEIDKKLEWSFMGDENEVIATEKLHGTCCAILIENGIVSALFNRTNRIPFIGGTLSKALTEGVNNSLDKNRFVMQDGLWWGELIGPRIQKNEYGLDEHQWIPFEWCKTHLAYKSWHRYPKTFENISKWFELPIEAGGIFSLFMKRMGINQKPEGIVFHNIKTGQMGKIRRDMFDWFEGKRH